jgi:CO dehydrogenase/acetyl-CoA synthase delta subunit
MKTEILERVCEILSVPILVGQKDEFVMKICKDIADGKVVLIDSKNHSICSLHPSKQEL